MLWSTLNERFHPNLSGHRSLSALRKESYGKNVQLWQNQDLVPGSVFPPKSAQNVREILKLNHEYLGGKSRCVKLNHDEKCYRHDDITEQYHSAIYQFRCRNSI